MIYTCNVNKSSSGHSITHRKGTNERGFDDEKGLNISERYVSHERGYKAQHFSSFDSIMFFSFFLRWISV